MTMKNHTSLLFLGRVFGFLTLALTLQVQAQQFPISGGNISTCAGVLEDSGGPTGPYANNENFTVIICPNVPGDGISLNWLIFTLSGAQPNPDRIRLWDGDGTDAPYLGEYFGNDLQGLVVSATTFNTSGCLTVQFISNGTGTGNFAAGISCFTPCDRPEAIAVMSEAVPAMICVGEEISFDGSASTAAPGFSIVSYTWNFDDGSTATGPSATHSFAEPGEYVVQLNLLDDNNCANTNVVDLQVLVSTTPVFSGTIESLVTCVGATVDLVGSVTPVTWTGLPDATFGEGVYLPDDIGIPFTSSLVFSQFEPGQTVTSVNDLISICVDMEHTFMGDLVLQVICPSGQTLILHQQGGGGTYLGGANDTDNNTAPVQGECWNYCWSPTATNGTWVDNSTTNTTIAGTPPNNSLNAGTYEPVQSFNNLIGCPLNGEWTYQSTDLWGADNGFICAWSINFDPSIIPDVTQFTPEINSADIDSAGWSGPGVTIDPNDASHATAEITAPGTYNYSFFATDNFGCTYDTTITITVAPQLQIDAGSDIIICNSAEQLNGTVVANAPPVGITWEWSPADGVTDVSDPQSEVLATVPAWYYLTAYPTGSPDCAVVDSVFVAPDPSIDAGQSAILEFCGGTPNFLMTDSLLGTPDTDGAWTDAAGNARPNVFNTLNDPSGTYTYTVTSPNGCIATSTLDITVIPPADPACCGVPDAGSPLVSCNLSVVLTATPGNTGVGQWFGPVGATFDDPFATVTQVTVEPGMGGSHWFYWRENDGAFCNTVDSVLMTFTDAINIEFIWTDAVCKDYCDGTVRALTTGGNTATDFEYSWSTGLEGIGEDELEGLCAGMYYLTIRDDNQCALSDSVLISEPPRLVIAAIEEQPVTCSGDCDGKVFVIDARGVEYSFDNGATWITTPTLDNACEDLYLIWMKDAAGCLATKFITVTGPPPVISDFYWNPEAATVEDRDVKFVNMSTGADRYEWDIAGLLETTEFEPSFSFSNKEPNEYPVCLISYNANNCVDTLCRTLLIDDVLQPYIPNSFTPDNDGLNDTWGISLNMVNITDLELDVFDRWGRSVFATTDPYFRWTGGAQNSEERLPSGTYVYRLTFTIAGTETRRELMGQVSIFY